MRNTWVSLIGKMLFTIVAFTMLLMPSSVRAQLDGEAIFKANCSSCHKPDKKVIGPALQGARENWAERTGSDEAIIAWVKNSQGYMKSSGDSYAKKLFEDYNKSVMTAMAVSDEEVLAVLDYVDSYAPPIAAVPAATGESAGVEEASDPTLWLIVIVVILFIVFRVLWSVSKNLRNLNRQKDGQDHIEEVDFLGALGQYFKKNQALTVIVIVLLSAYVAILGWDWLNGIGVYQSYQPTQPIWFSHKIHAGLNVCMNCHMAIAEVAEGTEIEWNGQIYGKERLDKEIAKVYDAAGWDPEELEYTGEEKPVKWVRIHNLPDLVYYNHAQHVTVGGIKCQTCHGPIEEMDEVYQYSELTMGWCINCHRETDVTMDDNGYYERIHNDLVEKHKEEGLETFKVEHIGGLECVKCHY